MKGTEGPSHSLLPVTAPPHHVTKLLERGGRFTQTAPLSAPLLLPGGGDAFQVADSRHSFPIICGLLQVSCIPGKVSLLCPQHLAWAWGSWALDQYLVTAQGAACPSWA